MLFLSLPSERSVYGAPYIPEIIRKPVTFGYIITALSQRNVTLGKGAARRKKYIESDGEIMYSDAEEALVVVGIDEAGRGPLAGPLAVGAVSVLERVQQGVLHTLSIGLGALRDSKQLTARERELWFAALEAAERRGELRFAVTLVSAPVIDARGISAATRLAVARVLKRLAPLPQFSSILLDGLLAAPKCFREQRTIIHGDETEPLISLASIAAKVVRDRYMVRMARRFPSYGFERHKGYGTSAHYAALERHGPCLIHRRLFLRGMF